MKIRVKCQREQKNCSIYMTFRIAVFFFKDFLEESKDFFDLDDFSNCISSNYMSFTVYAFVIRDCFFLFWKSNISSCKDVQNKKDLHLYGGLLVSL